MWSNCTNFSKGWPIFKACKLLQIADNHRNSVCQGQDQLRLVISLHTSANKHHQQISISCLLGSFIPTPFAKMSAWLGPSPLLPSPRDHFWCVKVSTCELFWVGKGEVNVRYCGHHNVIPSCVIWHLVSPYFWENHGKSHQILTFYSAICSLKKFRGREFLPFFAVFVTISQHPRPPVDLVLAFLPLDHGHIGIGTALGIFLKNRGICQKCPCNKDYHTNRKMKPSDQSRSFPCCQKVALGCLKYRWFFFKISALEWYQNQLATNTGPHFSLS